MVDINNESRGTYDEDNQVRFKTSILMSSLWDHSEVYILIKETITVASTAAQDADWNDGNKKLIFKNYVLFGDSDSYSKTSRILWQFADINRL